MDMSFEEKSAWGSLLAIALASWLFYPDAIAHISAGFDPIALTGKAVFVIVVIVIVEIITKSVAALSSKNQDADERDKFIQLKADRNSGYVLAAGIFTVIVHIAAKSMVSGVPGSLSSALIAVYLLLALTVSEGSKLLWQIWYYRAGI